MIYANWRDSPQICPPCINAVHKVIPVDRCDKHFIKINIFPLNDLKIDFHNNTSLLPKHFTESRGSIIHSLGLEIGTTHERL